MWGYETRSSAGLRLSWRPHTHERTRTRTHTHLQLRRVTERAFDAEHKRYYFYNRQTQESKWEPPRLLHGQPLEPLDEPAALRLQTAFRRFAARQKVLRLLNGQYEKGYSKSEGAWYYYNKVTGLTSWTKPRLYGVHEPPANESDAAIQEKEAENKYVNVLTCLHVRCCLCLCSLIAL